VLAGAGDSEELAEGLVRLLEDSEFRRRLGRNAHDDAHKRFDVARQARDYLAWYEEALGRMTTSELEAPVAR
jgi:glycosyltransferase involved in cell wall biosynthesis